MKNTVLFIMLMLPVHLYANDMKSIPIMPGVEPLAKMSVRSGQLFLNFYDGREASLFQEIGVIKRVKLGMRQIENTCDHDQALSNCYLEADLGSKKISLQWTKNPDSQKLGKSVVLKSSYSSMPNEVLEEERNIFWYDQFSDPSYRSLLKPDRFVCDNMEWAKNIAENDSRIRIESWGGEFMLQTPETKVNENQTISGVFNVVLKKIGQNALEFEKFGAAKGGIGLPPYISTQVANLTFKDKSGQQCQVAFEASIEQVVQEIGQEDFRKIDPSTKKPVLNPRVLLNTSMHYYMQKLLQRDAGLKQESVE